MSIDDLNSFFTEHQTQGARYLKENHNRTPEDNGNLISKGYRRVA